MDKMVVSALRECGPLTGKELKEHLRADDLELWRACRRNPEIRWSRAGERYLRLDRQVGGYGRLSPSIKREFLTYTVLGLAGDDAAREARARALREEFREISRAKVALAEERIGTMLAQDPSLESARTAACFLIAGDVVYGMAHREPRPESSMGKMVAGSDLDVIVVVPDDFPKETTLALDKAIYAEKYRLLIDPQHREEIDYVVKSVAKVRQQLAFDEFKHMVACKILAEALYLYGSRALFESLSRMVAEAGVPEKLKKLEEEATAFRAAAEAQLETPSADLPAQECWKLFYTSAEQDEIF